MKKALALVLALVLALSMAVSAFAADLVVLNKVPAETEDPTVVTVEAVDSTIEYLYIKPFADVDELADLKLGAESVLYIALAEDKNYKDVKVTTNGNVSAELVEYDPETMVVKGDLKVTYAVTYKGELMGDEKGLIDDVDIIDAYTDARDAEIAAYGETDLPKLSKAGYVRTQNLPYVNAVAVEAFFDDLTETDSLFGMVCEQYVNIIKLTVENNYTAHYTEGTIKIEATLDKKAYSKTLKVINDVANFEYEQVKYAAKNNADGAYLQLGDAGYSDFLADEYGYSVLLEDYDFEFLRNEEYYALVVSTTAFRAIEGEDLTLAIVPAIDFDDDEVKETEISVTLKDVAKGQKGVNFFAWADLKYDDRGDDDTTGDLLNNRLEEVTIKFMGKQVINGKFEVKVALPITYYQLREMFGIKVEEDDIISYYIVDENGKVVGGKEVDYMTADLTETVEFTVEGENKALGSYTLCLEVPAAESGEANPNTGAESVVGVVAALAVVSVATAAAVSLKK